MKFLSKLFQRKRTSKATPAVIKKIIQPDYNANTSLAEMRSDYAACRDLRKWVREHQGEEAFLKYLNLLDSFSTLIEADTKLEELRQAEQMALDKLNAAYAARLN